MNSGGQRTPAVTVVDYGIGNLSSALKAFEHIGASVELTDDPQSIASASAVVLPGVGSFGPTMSALRDLGLDSAISSFIDSGRPFLGICVGMQVLYESSEESPGVDGLGVLQGTVRALRGSVKVPQMQWNTIELVADGSGLFTGLGDQPWLYFVHSYAGEVSDHTTAICDYGEQFSAAVRKGNVFATQFHPEKSGASGLRILSNFVSLAANHS
ncbi:MAG: imidazole glycerol phosphate synthase subunit HisH [Microthrixaceae bacterium]|nr:imidazole glycerol phosphate synthase subunit HisH [Microthrixaceae bacterium]